MAAPGFLRSGPDENMALAMLGPRLGLLIHKAENMAVFPEVSRDGEETQPHLLWGPHPLLRHQFMQGQYGPLQVLE